MGGGSNRSIREKIIKFAVVVWITRQAIRETIRNIPPPPAFSKKRTIRLRALKDLCVVIEFAAVGVCIKVIVIINLQVLHMK